MTWEEYKHKREQHNVHRDNAHYSLTNIECPYCGEFIYKNLTMVLTTYPPQHSFRCMKCGWMGTSQ